MPEEPWHPRKGAKSDQVMQLNCLEVIKQPEHKRTWTTEEQNWFSFQKNYKSKQIANNSKSFANRSKSIKQNNLGLFKYSEIYLI